MNTYDSSGANKKEFWHSLFSANSVAVVGANAVAGSWGFTIMRQLIDSTKIGVQRQIYAVNPTASEILGVTSYKSILDVPHTVELAIIVVPAYKVPEVLSECAQKEVKATIIISAGFAEAGEAGSKLEAELIEITKDRGIHFIGPNCVGYADMHSKLASIGFANIIKPGPVALIAQSGTIGFYITTAAAEIGIGVSKFIGTGNEADQHLEDCLEYIAQDEDTRIVTAYIEGLREGRRFLQIAKEMTSSKPMVVIKAGGTKESARAARSHTAAMSGSEEIYAAAFRQAGIIRVDNEEELFDVVLALLNQPLPQGNRIGIFTIGGGLGVITAEACEKEGLRIAPLEQVTVEKLNAILPKRWSHDNPVDTVGMFIRPTDNTEAFLSCLTILMEDNNIDGVISLASPVISTFSQNNSLSPNKFKAIQIENAKNLNILNQQVKKHGKPLIIYDRAVFKSPKEADLLSLFFKEGIPVYRHPRRAAKVLSHLRWYRQYLDHLED